jgi:hypothetical protein
MRERPGPTLALLDDATLGVALTDLGRAVASPAPVTLADRVRARLEAEPQRGRPWLDLFRIPAGGRPRTRRLALVLALVALAVTAAVVGARLLDLPGLRLFFEPGPPPSAPASAAAASPGSSTPPGSRLGLGPAMALAEIERVAGFDVLLPDDPALGQPDAAYYDPELGAGHVTLVWAADADLPPVTEGSDAGLIVTQFPGSLDRGYFVKVVNTGNVYREVEVDGDRGFWIEDGIHFFYYVDPSGRQVDDTRRLVGDVLAFERDGRTVRIETAAGLDRALEIADAIR